MNRTTSILLLAACLGAILLRLVQLPFAYNFSALGALALFSGCLVRRAWLAILLTLGCRALTDVWLQARTGYGFYDGMSFDYAAYAMICLLGRSFSPRNTMAVVAGGIGSAVVFFLVSNFGVWFAAPDHAYERSLSGLMLCYTKGLPFARGTIMGDMLFTLVFFGGWNFLIARQSATVSSQAAVIPVQDPAESKLPTGM